jgi:hypothetical protein
MSITDVELPVSEQQHYQVLEYASNAIKDELSEGWRLAGLRVGYKLLVAGKEDSDEEYEIVYGNLKAVKDADATGDTDVKSDEDWKRILDEWDYAHQQGESPLPKGFVDSLYDGVKARFVEITGVDDLVAEVSAAIKKNPYVVAGAGCCYISRKRRYYYQGRRYCYESC